MKLIECFDVPIAGRPRLAGILENRDSTAM